MQQVSIDSNDLNISIIIGKIGNKQLSKKEKKIPFVTQSFSRRVIVVNLDGWIRLALVLKAIKSCYHTGTEGQMHPREFSRWRVSLDRWRRLAADRIIADVWITKACQ